MGDPVNGGDGDDWIREQVRALCGVLEGGESSSLTTCVMMDPYQQQQEGSGRNNNSSNNNLCIGLVLEYASWNKPCLENVSSMKEVLHRVALDTFEGLDCQMFHASIQIDENDDTESHCIGDYEENNNTKKDAKSSSFERPLPPSSLPALALVLLDRSNSDSDDDDNNKMSSSSVSPVLEWRYVKHLPPSSDLVRFLVAKNSPNNAKTETEIFMIVPRRIRSAANALADDWDLPVQAAAAAAALRIFIAGDRSSVGKSSICLGLLGHLRTVQAYPADSLAYIKPATQSESTQLVQLYCERHGMECRPVGPLVYYRGFTRAFLAGETESTDHLLDQCGRAVDRMARGKKVILVDGVGFPAVGSICGTDNAAVAKACSYPMVDGVGVDDRDTGDNKQDEITNASSSWPRRRKPMGVVLVGGSGVGAAVDAFNLNATYFEQAHVPVLGAIFNKLSDTGFYSLENCRTQVSRYFETNAKQQQLDRQAFGFVPAMPEIAGPQAMQHVDDYIRVFGNHVNVASIVEKAQQVQQQEQEPDKDSGSMAWSLSETTTSSKRQKVAPTSAARNNNRNNLVRDRKDIEMAAIHAGAAPSA